MKIIKLYAQTLKEIFLRPRNVVDSFIHSDTSRFQHPMVFMLIGVVVVMTLNTILVNFSADVSLMAGEYETEQLQQLSEWVFISTIRLSTQFLPFMLMVLLVPMLSLAGLFFFRNEMDGFYSNLILNSYLIGTAIPVLVFMIPFWSFSGRPLADTALSSVLPGLLIASAGIWVYKQYFSISGLIGWIRILSSFIAGYLLFILLKGFTAGVAGYMIFAVKRILEVQGS